jgi:Zn-dependent protease with chaperone function
MDALIAQAFSEAILHSCWLAHAVMHGHAGSAAAALAVSGLFAAVWQGAVLAACVLICLRLLPGLSAAARSVVWLNVFLLLVLLHVLPYFGSHALAGFSGSGAAHRAPFELGLGWCLGIAAVWAVLSLVRAAQLTASAMRLHGLSERAVPIETDAAMQALLTAKIGGVRRTAELCTSNEVPRPSVLGFLRPRILLPPELLERLTAAELAQVVVHEMEHLRRGDDWTNLLQKLALVAFPLNPALWWVESRLCAERELACDDRVLQSTGARKAYAICLTHLAEFSMLRRGVSLALGAWEKQSELVRRVHRILRRPGATMSGRRTLALTAGLMVAVAGGGLGLARSPQLVGFRMPIEDVEQASALPAAAFAREPVRRVETEQRMVNAMMPMPSSGVTEMSLKAAVHPVKPKARKRRPRLQYTVALNSVAQDATELDTVARNEMTPEREAAKSFVVMTEWRTTQVAPQMVFTVQHIDPQSGVRKAYAAVATPAGWLLFEI